MGTGLIGPYAIQELFEAFSGARIGTVTRRGRNYLAERAFKLDRNDLAAFERAFEEAAPDLLIDMVPFTATDAQNTATLIRRRRPDLPVIAISSIDVYSAYARLHRTEDVPYQECPISEEMALRTRLGPGSEGERYDKLNVERIYREVLENVTILRLPAVYGWPDRRRIDPYMKPMLAGESAIEIARSWADWRFSRCLHRNAAHAIRRLAEAGQSGQHVYNLAEEQAHSERQWCEMIAECCGWRGDIRIVDRDEQAHDLGQDFVVSSQKIRDEIGFTERYDPNEGLADAVKLIAADRFGGYEQSY